MLLLSDQNYTPYPQYKEIFKAISQVKPDLNEIESLVKKHGIDVIVDSTYKLTPLILGCLQGQPDVVQKLIDLKANINYCAGDCYPALGYAVRDSGVQSPKITLLLIKHGADPTNSYILSAPMTPPNRHPHADVKSLIENFRKLKSGDKKDKVNFDIGECYEKLGAKEDAQIYFQEAVKSGNLDIFGKLTSITEDIIFALETAALSKTSSKEREPFIQQLEKIANNSLEQKESKSVVPLPSAQIKFEAFMALGRIHLKLGDRKIYHYYGRASEIKEAKIPENTQVFLSAMVISKTDYYDLTHVEFKHPIHFQRSELLLKAAQLKSPEALSLITKGVGAFLTEFEELWIHHLLAAQPKTEIACLDKFRSDTSYKMPPKYLEGLLLKENPRRSVILFQEALKSTRSSSQLRSISFSLADAAARLVLSSYNDKIISEHVDLLIKLYQQVHSSPVIYTTNRLHCCYVLAKLISSIKQEDKQIAMIDLLVRFNRSGQLEVISYFKYLLTLQFDNNLIYHLHNGLAQCHEVFKDKKHFELAITHYQEAAKLKPSEQVTINNKINTLHKKIADLKECSDEDKVKQLELALANGDSEAGRLLVDTKMKSSNYMQEEVMIFLSQSMQSACDRKEVKEVEHCLNAFIGLVSKQIVDNLDDQVQQSMLIAYHLFWDEEFTKANPKFADILYKSAKKFLALKLGNAEKSTEFCRYFIAHKDQNISELQILARGNYFPALFAVLENYKARTYLGGKSFRQRAQMLLTASCCLLEFDANKLVGFSELRLTKFFLATDDDSYLRNHQKAQSSANSYIEFASWCLAQISHMKGGKIDNFHNLLLHLMANVKNNTEQSIVSSFKDAAADAFGFVGTWYKELLDHAVEFTPGPKKTIVLEVPREKAAAVIIPSAPVIEVYHQPISQPVELPLYPEINSKREQKSFAPPTPVSVPSVPVQFLSASSAYPTNIPGLDSEYTPYVPSVPAKSVASAASIAIATDPVMDFLKDTFSEFSQANISDSKVISEPLVKNSDESLDVSLAKWAAEETAREEALKQRAELRRKEEEEELKKHIAEQSTAPDKIFEEFLAGLSAVAPKDSTALVISRAAMNVPSMSTALVENKLLDVKVVVVAPASPPAESDTVRAEGKRKERQVLVM